ncbi:MAG: GNAT family N-acetyltransferase [Armatimonadetes bacterium]|nr:GNAT family N-acetyltransferase [Armatimonadota bacterium]
MKPVPVLEGKYVRLEPATYEHAADLAATTDPSTFVLFTVGAEDQTPEAMRVFLDHLFKEGYPMVMRLKETGEVVGCSTFFDIHDKYEKLEIGYTWIRSDLRGTRVNPEAKFLMLQYAFESAGMDRVCLKTDERNLQSQHAIEKLGAKKDGVLRHFTIMRDGHRRNTVFYSILKDEWPEVKARLLERLG